MSENMTYDAEPTRAQLATRVQELERALAQADSNMVALAARNAELAARLAELEPSGFAMTNRALAQHVHQLAHENAELRARLDAVPVRSIRFMLNPHRAYDSGTSLPEAQELMRTFISWAEQAVQP